MLRIVNLDISWGTKKVLSVPRLEIAKGDVVFIYAGNGTGKSSLLKFIAAQDESGKLNSIGEINYPESFSYNTKLDIRRNTVVVPQNERFTSNETIYDFLTFRVKYGIVSLPDKQLNLEEYVDTYCNDNLIYNALHLKNIRDMKKCKIRQLSEGQKHILSIYGALFCNGDKHLYLFDEPLNHLDYDNGRNVLNTITRLHYNNSKSIILICSHCKSITIANRFFTIKDAKIIEQDANRFINFGCFGMIDNKGFYI